MLFVKKNYWLYLILSLLIVFFDQLTKKYIFFEVGLNNSKQFIPGVIQFTVVQNTGGAFSIFKQYPIYFKIIGVINVLVFSYLALCPTVTFNTTIKTGCAFVLGGTLGNLIDRFIKGGVVDFLDIQLFNFAVFNLADVFIDIGVIMVLIGWYISKRVASNK